MGIEDWAIKADSRKSSYYEAMFPFRFALINQSIHKRGSFLICDVRL